MADIDENALRARELAIKERQITLEEGKLEAEKPHPFREWVKALGIPLAGLSIFMPLIVQANDQISARANSNGEAGWRYYSEKQTSLHSSADVEKELALLQTASRAFPNIYCDVRLDLYNRIARAEPGAGEEDIDRTDINLLTNQVVAQDRPLSKPSPASLWEAVKFGEPNTPQPCGPLKSAEPPVVVAKAEPSVPFVSTPAAPAPPPAQPSSDLMRITMFVIDGGPRAGENFDTLRADLGSLNYRMVRRIEHAAATSFPKRAQVRFFGAGRAKQAQDLAKLLSHRFAGDGIAFITNDLSKAYPNVPDTIIEVWLPDPTVAAVAVVTPPEAVATPAVLSAPQP